MSIETLNSENRTIFLILGDMKPYINLVFALIAWMSIQNSNINAQVNILDYAGTPDSAQHRNALAFSDKGAWFAYGFPTDKNYYGGFSGPFLMTQENGVWSSKSLTQLQLIDNSNGSTKNTIDWNSFTATQKSYTSHLEQIFKNEQLEISQTVFFTSPHTAFINTKIKNISTKKIELTPSWKGTTYLESLKFEKVKDGILIRSTKSKALGRIRALNEIILETIIDQNNYQLNLKKFTLEAGKTKQLLTAQSFIFPNYSGGAEYQNIMVKSKNIESFLRKYILQKEDQLDRLTQKLDTTWTDSIYKNLLIKTLLTLQNNWRVPAGELKHSGLFPSYHYEWFHGFWAWDSWKHAVALAHFNPNLAKQQISAMFDFQNDNGFIADCVYRDTKTEKHNYRNTKPPLSAWAAWEVYKETNDSEFLKEIYPKIVKQHYWWYKDRDHDKDGLCEYGSTDGTLVAAKWESGMDNAVRFDESKILKNAEHAFSLDQESVDLNAYLFAEKNYLIKMATILLLEKDEAKLSKEADKLKEKIQEQFYDKKTGWFYDTSIDGKTFITTMGCEGWIPLWANVATEEQAQSVHKNMLNEKLFNTKVPLQTLSADHPKFKPEGGYWRGPNWLDQAYFGIKGLQNYGYSEDAKAITKKLFHNAEGVLEKGKSIRENYNPITGKGLESENFSWSAAHYMLLLLGE